jgi:hypothetical protein
MNFFAAAFSSGDIARARERGEHGDLQTQRSGEEGLPERGVPSVVDGGGPEGPEPRERRPPEFARFGAVSLFLQADQAIHLDAQG